MCQDNRLNKSLGLARHYAYQYGGMLKEYPSVTIDDLYQECLIGLNTACERFDPEKGVKFEYIAAIWMKQRMVSFLQKEGGTVKIPFSKKQSDGENNFSFTYIDSIHDDEDDDGFNLIDEIEEDEQAEQLVMMDSALDKLRESDRHILTLYYGLGNHQRLTHQQIGDLLGVSKRRAGQRIEEAEARLREAMKVSLIQKKKKPSKPRDWKAENARRAEYFKEYRERNRQLLRDKNVAYRLKKKRSEDTGRKGERNENDHKEQKAWLQALRRVEKEIFGKEGKAE